MQISEIKIRKIIGGNERLKAIVSITLDDSVAVHDIKVISGNDRLFVAMPSRRDESGIYRDIIHPISESARKMIESQILTAYKDYITKAEAY